MAIVPIRDLGSVGLIKDISEFALPLNAVSNSRNIFFYDRTVRRAHAFKTIQRSPPVVNPVFSYNVQRSGQVDRVLLVDKSGYMYTVRSGSYINATKAGWVANNSTEAFGATLLASNIYVNRSVEVPVKLSPTGTQFTVLDNWPSNWRCGSLRSYAGYLLAMNMTEEAVSYDKRLRWSNIAIGQNEPDSWDATDTTKNAGFNDFFLEIEGPLVDGAKMGDSFCLYTKNECVLMQQVPSASVFAFRRAFTNVGVVNKNCIVELNNSHVVMGSEDIVVHNGSGIPTSILKDRLRTYYRQTIDINSSYVCFAYHDPFYSRIYFAYRSISGTDPQWPRVQGANEAIVWNYKDDTLQIFDLPNVGVPCSSVVGTILTWDDMTFTWDNFARTWESLGDVAHYSTVFPSLPNSKFWPVSALLASDGIAYESRLSFPWDNDYVAAAYVERKGIDADLLGGMTSGYKLVKTVYPLVKRTANGRINFLFYSSLYPDGPYTASSTYSYDPRVDHKMDFKHGGRFMGYKLAVSGTADLYMTGMDWDIDEIGER